jgi:hypothetical protein
LLNRYTVKAVSGVRIPLSAASKSLLSEKLLAKRLFSHIRRPFAPVPALDP